MPYTLSTLIEKLQSMQNGHGDLPIYVDFDGVDDRLSNVEIVEPSQQKDVNGDPEPLPHRIKLW